MATIESRSVWGARQARGSTAIRSTKGVKAHYTGGRVDPATLTDHAKCRALVRAFQTQHMDGNGWQDIGYSMVACEHAVMVGRGPKVLPAANGAGLNSDHYAILLLVGNAGVVHATDNMKRNFHAARDYLRVHGGAGDQIKGHRDGYSTDCPGDDIYAWVRAGAPRPGNPAPPAPTPTEDTMEYGSFELTTPRVIPAGVWVPIPWDKENADPGNSHSSAQETILATPEHWADYTLEAGVELTGVTPGAAVSLRASEYEYVAATKTAPAVDKLVEAGWEDTRPLPDSGRAHLAAVGHVQKGRKLRVEVMIHADAATVGSEFAVKRAAVKYLANR